MSWLSVFCSIAADELADCGGDAYRADDEHDERACDEFGAQREPVETVEEEFGEGLMLGFERGGFRRGACGGNGESVVPGTAVAAIVTVIAVDATGAGDERFREHRLDVIGNGLVDGTVTRHERIARMEPRLGFVKLCGLHGPRVHGLTAFILIAPTLALPAVLRSGLGSELRGGFNGISRGFRSFGNRLNNAHDSTCNGVVSRFVSQTAGLSTRSGQGFSRVLSRLISGLLVSSALVPMTIAVCGTAPAFLAALAFLPRGPAGRLTGMTSTVRAGAPADAHGTPGVGQVCSASADAEASLSVGRRCDARLRAAGAPAPERVLAYTLPKNEV